MPTLPDVQNGIEEDEAIHNEMEEGLYEIKETSSCGRVTWSLHILQVLSVDRILRCGLHTEENDVVEHVETTMPSVAILRTTMMKRKSVFTRSSDFHRQLGGVTVFSFFRISEGFSLQPIEEVGAGSQNRVVSMRPIDADAAQFAFTLGRLKFLVWRFHISVLRVSLVLMWTGCLCFDESSY
ncbi:hypothetical protein EDD16DRAFT_1225289 [Pisolithus croceorrhizus]|nr:hypothetical protein EDD16DRAFT_1225289 [Pisolithus croceorrhizus]